MIQCTVTVIVLEIIANYGNIVKTEIIVSKPNSASNEYSSLKDERKWLEVYLNWDWTWTEIISRTKT